MIHILSKHERDMIFHKLLLSRETDFTILSHDQTMEPKTFHYKQNFIPFCHKQHKVFDETYLHWIRILVRLLGSKIFGDGRRCNTLVLLVLLMFRANKFSFFYAMTFVIKNHCPMLIINVIFHGHDSMLQIVGDESLLKRNGQTKIMALFGGVAKHTPQGLA